MRLIDQRQNYGGKENHTPPPPPPPPGGNHYINRTEEIEDDRINEGMENLNRINKHLQEITLEREDVISYGFENPGILIEDLTPLEKNVSCIHNIQYPRMALFEITAKSVRQKLIGLTLERPQIAIHGTRIGR